MRRSPLDLQIAEAAGQFSEAFTAYVTALKCPRLYSPDDIRALRRRRDMAERRLVELEALRRQAQNSDAGSPYDSQGPTIAQ